MITIETPEEVSAAMEELGLSRGAFAEEVGVDPTTVSRWLNGKVKITGTASKLIARLLQEHRARPAEAAE